MTEIPQNDRGGESRYEELMTKWQTLSAEARELVKDFIIADQRIGLETDYPVQVGFLETVIAELVQTGFVEMINRKTIAREFIEDNKETVKLLKVRLREEIILTVTQEEIQLVNMYDIEKNIINNPADQMRYRLVAGIIDFVKGLITDEEISDL